MSCPLRRVVELGSFGMKLTHIGVALLIVALCAPGCAAPPKILTSQQFDSESKRLMPLSGYHQDYLGSDDQYHYIRIGIATGERDYLIRKTELPIKDTYPYVATNPRIEPLSPRLFGN